ncbi:MAG: chemotaxis protein CheA [Firmicutes bacterium]|nr:chemotaxis protein CheA [Bacillota bacterium]
MQQAENTWELVDPELFSVFMTETNEQIEQLVSILLHLEQEPQQQTVYINEMFRIAHNIKGSSGMVGMDDVKETMHELENLFGLVRDGKRLLEKSEIDLLLQFTDALKDYFQGNAGASSLLSWKERFEGMMTATGPAALSKPLQEVPLVLSRQEKLTVASWQEEGKPVYGVELFFTQESPMRSSVATAFFRHLQNYGKILTAAPPLNQLAEDDFAALKLVLLRETPLSLEDEEAIYGFPAEGIREIKIRLWTYHEEARIGDRERFVETHTIRVESDRIDHVINQVGKLLTLKTSLRHLYDHGYQGKATWQQLGKSIQELEQITNNLQDRTLELRMIPMRRLFARFPKIVRDIARQSGKKVELKFSGEDTEIDKEIAEELVDPLTHLLRNSVDHGLEESEERKKLGKDETGHILVEARQEGGHIVINVTDDGRGIDLEKVREKALGLGLISNEEYLSNRELTALLFHPGFSTAEQVSDVSGRGVGLDVVKDKINELKGSIEVKTEFGQGTTFSLRLPLTLAIIQAFMVKIGDQVFGLPVTDMERSLVIKESEIHYVNGRPIYYRYPEVIPLLDLGKRFNFPFKHDPLRMPVVIVNYGRSRVGFVVQELLGLEDIMIKSLQKSMGKITDISGAAFLGSGDIALILDTQTLARDLTALN